MVRIDYKEKLPDEDNDFIIRQLEKQSNAKKGIDSDIKTFSFTIRSDEKDFIGAVSGFSYYGCLHISLLFIKEEYRGKGYAKQQLEKSEHLAKERICKLVTVNSMDWEAHEYYLKLGYDIDYIQSGYAQNSQKYFLRKGILL